MAAVVVALLLAQDIEIPDLFGPPDEPPAVPAPTPKPAVPPAPLVIPPADGPVPDGVPTPNVAAPVVRKKAAPDRTREVLLEERLQLLRELPSFTPPTIATTLGGLALIIGGTLTAVGATYAFSDRAADKDKALFYLGAPLGVLGLAGLVFGLIWERERWLNREPYVDRIDAIERELGW